MASRIHENGRIDGIRVTIYSVMDYYKKYSVAEITEILPLNEEQVRTAIAYIEANFDRVNPIYQKMLERDAAGDSPEVRAILESRKHLMGIKMKEAHQRIAERKRLAEQAIHAGNSG